MRFSENRKIACVVLAAVIIASLLIGGGGALAQRRTALLNQYNASSFSISAELLEMRSNAVKLQSIASKYDNADKNIISALTAAVNALDDAGYSGDISDQYSASLQLDTAVENCYANLSGLTLNSVDTSDIRYAYKNFTSAQLRINHDSYNELAAQFNADRASFPANLLCAVCGIKPLELFQASQTSH